jgi:PncC family amidohydrolase
MNLVETALSKGIFLCAAESLTAGRVATQITETPGASKVFLGSVVSYSDSSKTGFLAVSPRVLDFSTAVSSEVAVAMAKSARAEFSQKCEVEADKIVAVSTTGVAGPDLVGPNPVGRVFIGLSSKLGDVSFEYHFSGSRSQIAQLATDSAVQLIWEHLDRL